MSSRGVRSGLRALAGAGLWILTGCGVIIQVMKAWRDAPARRAGAAWSGQLDRELASLGDPVSALTRVNTGEQAAVAPAVEGVRLQVERVRPLVQAHESELPRALLEGWEKLSGWARVLGKP